MKCYHCNSTKSWHNCEYEKKEVNCTAGLDRCVKVYSGVRIYGASVESYEKGCKTKAWCLEKIPVCKEGDECIINCCRGDLCNGAAVQMVRAIILIACALVAALIL